MINKISKLSLIHPVGCFCWTLESSFFESEGAGKVIGAMVVGSSWGLLSIGS